jgi:phenylalanyl-tRNA synthetase beta chain
VLVGDVVVGTIGEIHPSVAAAFGIEGRVVAAEMDLAPLVIDRGPWQFEAPSAFPPVIFDMAFIVDASTPASDLLASATHACGDLLEEVTVFDVFRSADIGDGRKSLALRFRVRAADRTLTDEEAAPIRVAIAEAVSKDVGGTLRGAL